MSSAYSALPSLPPKDEAETKPLVDSMEEFGGYASPSAKVPPKKMLALAYFLCALTVFLAGINLVAIVKAKCFRNNHHVSVAALPRPDIFTGLPKHREIISPGHANKNEHEGNHTHTHIHEYAHSDCKCS